MSSKKPFKPRWLKDFRVATNLINLHVPFTEDEFRQLAEPIREAFHMLRCGEGTERHWSDLEAITNVVIIRAKKLPPVCLEAAKAASDALVRCWLRHKQRGVWRLDGPAITELEIVIDLHEQLIRLSTPKEMVDAIKEVRETRLKREAELARDQQRVRGVA